MGPESVLAFSLSILVICGNSGVYTNTVLARRNLHGDVRAPGLHLQSISKNDNGPYQFRRLLQKEADPKVASIASVAADASLDVTKTMAKEISDAIALAVANAVAKIFAEQSATSEQDSEKLPENVPVASDDVKPNSNEKHDSKYGNVGYRRLSIKGSQEEPEDAYEVDDNESRPADNTRKSLKTSDADQSKITRRTFNDNQTLAFNQDAQVNPTVNYRRNAIIILHHRNNSGPSYQERINVSRRYHQSIHEQRDDDYDEAL